jgi:hypothetical protein
MEFLLPLLMFLAGWFVCWIQMSKSDSRKYQQLMIQHQSLESAGQERQLKFQRLQERYVNQFQELSQLRYQLGQLEYQKSLVVGELWRLKNPVAPAEFESQQWKSPYPESAPLSAVAEANPDSNATVNP